MRVLHISAECYPAAKAGGLGDVAGALPKYLNQIDIATAVVIPKYQTAWLDKQTYEEVFRGSMRMHHGEIPFAILEVTSADLGFPLYVADIPGKFDRPGIYADVWGNNFGDELERALSFQGATLQWLLHMEEKPDILHCHDHHTGLIPFFVKYSPEYQALSNIPTVFTIHNGEYHGSFSWDNAYLLPYFYSNARGLLDWYSVINPLAAAIKSCWRLTTVSPTYMSELRSASNGLEWLISHEAGKSRGILNGIDTQVWDPASDPYLEHHLKDSADYFKFENKRALAEQFQLPLEWPIITFIGRLAREKGADLIPDTIRRFYEYGHRAAFIILGSGDAQLQHTLMQLGHRYHGRMTAIIAYNEGLSHRLYAGSDFMFMPSRVEPCGLNQMYAMRYGTVPVVRKVGGLRDTVPDIGEPNGSGRGIQFSNFTVEDAVLALYRATDLYRNTAFFHHLRQHIMQVDFSWERSAAEYAALYKELK